MESATPARVLIVAHRTAATPGLLEACRKRANEGPAAFSLLVPKTVHGMHRVVDAEDVGHDEAQLVLDLALPLISDAVGGEVDGIIGDPNPVDAVADAVNVRGFDEIIVSTLPKRVSKWMRMDLPSKLGGLGIPVTTVVARDAKAAESAAG